MCSQQDACQVIKQIWYSQKIENYRGKTTDVCKFFKLHNSWFLAGWYKYQHYVFTFQPVEFCEVLQWNICNIVSKHEYLATHSTLFLQDSSSVIEWFKEFYLIGDMDYLFCYCALYICIYGRTSITWVWLID